MKNILIILIIILSSTLFEHTKNAEYVDYKVLGKFILGKDTLDTINIVIDTLITEYDTTEKYGIIKIDIIISKAYFEGNIVKVKLLFVNNLLYGVRYYPKDETELHKYIKYLDRVCKNYFKYKIWYYYDRVMIEYDMERDLSESFKHYDIQMYLKYDKKYKLKI